MCRCTAWITLRKMDVFSVWRHWDGVPLRGATQHDQCKCMETQAGDCCCKTYITADRCSMLADKRTLNWAVKWCDSLSSNVKSVGIPPRLHHAPNKLLHTCPRKRATTIHETNRRVRNKFCVHNLDKLFIYSIFLGQPPAECGVGLLGVSFGYLTRRNASLYFLLLTCKSLAWGAPSAWSCWRWRGPGWGGARTTSRGRSAPPRSRIYARRIGVDIVDIKL